VIIDGGRQRLFAQSRSLDVDRCPRFCAASRPDEPDGRRRGISADLDARRRTRHRRAPLVPSVSVDGLESAGDPRATSVSVWRGACAPDAGERSLPGETAERVIAEFLDPRGTVEYTFPRATSAASCATCASCGPGREMKIPDPQHSIGTPPTAAGRKRLRTHRQAVQGQENRPGPGRARPRAERGW